MMQWAALETSTRYMQVDCRPDPARQKWWRATAVNPAQGTLARVGVG